MNSSKRAGSQGGPAFAKRPRTTLPPVYTSSPNIDTEIAQLASAKWHEQEDAGNIRIDESRCGRSRSVAHVYSTYVCSEQPFATVAALDRHHYFQDCLWPEFVNISSSLERNDSGTDWASFKSHVFSIIALFNFRQDNHPSRASDFLEFFLDAGSSVSTLVETIFRLESNSLSVNEQCMRVSFLTHLYRYVDHPAVKSVLLPLLSLPVWVHLSDAEQARQLELFPYLRKPLSKLRRRASKRDPATEPALPGFAIFSLVCELERIVVQCFPNPRDELLAVLCELVSLLTELLSQLRLRRTLFPLLSDRRTLALLQGLTLELVQDARTGALRWWPAWLRILEQFSLYFTFPLDPLTGEALPRDSIRADRAKRLLALQRESYAVCQSDSLPADHILRKVAFGSHGAVGNAEFLRRVFMSCDQGILKAIEEALGMGTLSLALSKYSGGVTTDDGSIESHLRCLLNAMASYCHIEDDALESFRATPVMITEQDLWGPGGANNNRLVAALPTLNVVFLNIHDYLLRNFTLYKGESAWAIREDIEDAIGRLQPSFEDDSIKFGGWAKMAAPLMDVSLIEVGNMILDSNAPEHVKVEIEVDLSRVSNSIRREWFDLERHDVLFLLRLTPVQKRDGMNSEGYRNDEDIKRIMAQSVVRGFIVEVSHSLNSGVKDNSRQRSNSGSKLKLSGLVDNLQFALDSGGNREVYEEFLKGFDVVVRRRSEVNNFFPVLSSIRNLVLSERQILPDWIQTILLGRPRQSTSKDASEEEFKLLDFGDSFVSKDHVIASFPDMKIRFSDSNTDDVSNREGCQRESYRIKFWRKAEEDFAEVICYQRANNALSELQYTGRRIDGWNTTAFNLVQVQAISSGLKPGLTLISGPPGTGKTSCTVQIITTIYQSIPSQRILLITKTNHALNDLVGRLLQRDIDPLKVLRLGQGESEMAWGASMSKTGRVNAMLRRRLHLLSKVWKMSNSLDRPPTTEADWNCESSIAFFKEVVETEWEEFKKMKSESWEDFPFRKFIDDEIEKEKGEQGKNEVLLPIRGVEESYAFISMIFNQIKEFRFLEVLLSSRQRESYLVTAHSRIIAMTCIHAAMQREDLVSHQFAYDTLIVEEAAECLEIEAFLSIVLQSPGRLKRVVLVGDHKQLPPVVQDSVLQQKSNLGQSMFTRLVRTGQNVVQLSHQGRCRSSIGDLFRWRYKDLSDMNFIRSEESFSRANPGFRYTAQFIDTGEVHSETQPLPHYHQNLAEAEYIAFTFLYMRILGYDCDQIAVLTTYNGQVQLLREVISARSSQFGDFGMPFAICTVDKFQSRQADYVLLSLVKTRGIGHFRDMRRITVAVSRARYGLYIFGYLNLFSSSEEMKPVLQLLPTCHDLTLVAGETRAGCTRMEKDDCKFAEGQVRKVHSPADMGTIVSYMQSA